MCLTGPLLYWHRISHHRHQTRALLLLPPRLHLVGEDPVAAVRRGRDATRNTSTALWLPSEGEGEEEEEEEEVEEEEQVKSRGARGANPRTLAAWA